MGAGNDTALSFSKSSEIWLCVFSCYGGQKYNLSFFCPPQTKCVKAMALLVVQHPLISPGSDLPHHHLGGGVCCTWGMGLSPNRKPKTSALFPLALSFNSKHQFALPPLGGDLMESPPVGLGLRPGRRVVFQRPDSPNTGP